LKTAELCGRGVVVRVAEFGIFDDVLAFEVRRLDRVAHVPSTVGDAIEPAYKEVFPEVFDHGT